MKAPTEATSFETAALRPPQDEGLVCGGPRSVGSWISCPAVPWSVPRYRPI